MNSQVERTIRSVIHQAEQSETRKKQFAILYTS